ncbi:hypothetical protein [Chitinilyticum piscinae]|uniref:Uncharacterized protein n=1 Tax=Chitinilyticum piscinae TaxID=2866724 RepID=A0A8J7FN58_9NEIS|nr:hypothetical protein [Chitinilyticum piscinae]MBE9609721.1 hypothetical protein [Chitinilyticum piscinae]
MKHWIISLALFAGTASAVVAAGGVSVNIGKPDFYGRIVLGDQQPQIIYPQPVIISPPRDEARPVYVRVPPGHERHWGKHCWRYEACDRPVYFVRDSWYRTVYVPAYYRRHAVQRDDDRYAYDDRYRHGHRHGWHGRDHDDD